MSSPFLVPFFALFKVPADIVGDTSTFMNEFINATKRGDFN
jgi:hypothetical protein